MGRTLLGAGLLSLLLFGSCLAERGYVYFSFTPPKGAKKADVEKAAKTAARTLQARCKAYGYLDIVADTVHESDDSWLVRLKQSTTGFTPEMLPVIRSLGSIEGQSASLLIGHTLTVAEAQQFKTPEREADLSKCPSPQGTQWYLLVDGSIVLCANESLGDMRDHCLTSCTQAKHWGDFEFGGGAVWRYVEERRRAAIADDKVASPCYLLVDNHFVIPLDLEWHEYPGNPKWHEPHRHLVRATRAAETDQWVEDSPGYWEPGMPIRILEGKCKGSDGWKKALAVCLASVGWPPSSDDEKKAISACAWPLPFPLTMEENADKRGEEGK